MTTSRRALYNSLRMNWLLDPSFEVEAWQIEDYRAMPLDVIFERLENAHIHLDKTSFLAFADTVDTPEELTDSLLADSDADEKTYDQVYLLIFELWRRLLPEKPCLTIFCDEIDHQIHLFDRNLSQNAEAIQDALANLQVLLDENVDTGTKPQSAFEYVNEECANDLESFLQDFISEQIDNGNDLYASDLLDAFGPYVKDVRWFDFLRARIIAQDDPDEANQIIEKLLKSKVPLDLEFLLEILAFLVSSGERKVFEDVARRISDRVSIEEDFQSLVAICADFYHRLDMDQVENDLQKILKSRQQIDLDAAFSRNDPHLAEFLKILSLK